MSWTLISRYGTKWPILCWCATATPSRPPHWLYLQIQTWERLKFLEFSAQFQFVIIVLLTEAIDRKFPNSWRWALPQTHPCWTFLYSSSTTFATEYTCIQLVLATLPSTQYSVRILSTAKMLASTCFGRRGLSEVTWPRPRRRHASARCRCLCRWISITAVVLTPSDASSRCQQRFTKYFGYRNIANSAHFQPWVIRASVKNFPFAWNLCQHNVLPCYRRLLIYHYGYVNLLDLFALFEFKLMFIYILRQNKARHNNYIIVTDFNTFFT